MPSLETSSKARTWFAAAESVGARSSGAGVVIATNAWSRASTLADRGRISREQFRAGSRAIRKSYLLTNSVPEARKPIEISEQLQVFASSGRYTAALRALFRTALHLSPLLGWPTPYDLAGTTCLVIEKRHLEGELQVQTDGNVCHWTEAFALCQAELGNGNGCSFQ